MNVTLNRAVAMDVTNIENININWDGFAAPTFNLEDVDGATVTITSARTGYFGNATFNETGENNISAGAGITGTLTVDAIEDASVTATVADTITITGADGAITVNAGAAETVAVTGGETVTVIALLADDIDLTTDFDVATVTLGVDADVVVDGADDSVVNLNSDEDITVTIEATSEFEVLNLGGEGAIALNFAAANAIFVEDFVLTNGGDITLSGTAGAADLSGVEHETIRMETAATGAITLGADANIVLEAAPAAGVTFQMHEDLDTAADSMTLTLEVSTGQDLIFTTADQEIESVTVNIMPNDDFDTDDDFTIHDLVGSNAADGPATVFTIVSDDEDVNVALTAVIAATIDASGVAGEFDGNQTAATDQDMTVIAAAGASSFDFVATTQDSTFISGNDADDIVTFDTTEGTAVAEFAGGDNSVSLAAGLLAAGTFAVLGADGDETVTIQGNAAGTITLLLGDGDNTVTTGDLGAATLVIEMGAGDDVVNLNAANAIAANIIIDMGTGTNRIDLADDANLTGSNVILEGVDIIRLAAGAAATFTSTNTNGVVTTPFDDTDFAVRSTVLDGQSYEIQGTGANGTPAVRLGVELGATARSFDGSNLTISDSIANAALGLTIGVTTVAGNHTIVGSEGSDEIFVGTGANVVTGGDGGDTITFFGTSTARNTVIIANDDHSTTTVGGTGEAGTVTDDYDIIIGLTTGTTAALKDLIDLPVAAVLATAATVAANTAVESVLEVGTGTVVDGHTVSATGRITFLDTANPLAAVLPTDEAHLAAIVQYLSLNDLGDAGATVVFHDASDESYIYQQTATTTGAVGGFTLIHVSGVELIGVETTASTTDVIALIG